MRIILTSILICLFANSSFATSWDIDQSRSQISFSGEHAGTAFKGRFKSFGGEIVFNKNNLAKSFAEIKIDLSSATVDNSSYAKTLPQHDWLDVKSKQFASFKTNKISNIKANEYQVEGILEIKSIEIPHSFKAKIDVRGNVAELYAKTNIKRLAFDIGKTSDNTGDWVSLDIPVEIKLYATHKTNLKNLI